MHAARVSIQTIRTLGRHWMTHFRQWSFRAAFAVEGGFRHTVRRTDERLSMRRVLVGVGANLGLPIACGWIRHTWFQEARQFDQSPDGARCCVAGANGLAHWIIRRTLSCKRITALFPKEAVHAHRAASRDPAHRLCDVLSRAPDRRTEVRYLSISEPRGRSRDGNRGNRLALCPEHRRSDAAHA